MHENIPISIDTLTDNSWLSMNLLISMDKFGCIGLDQVLEEGDRDAEVFDDEDSLVLSTGLHAQIVFCSSY